MAGSSCEILKSLIVVVPLLWTTASSLYYFPHSLSYFNEVAGGPENGAAHLVDSNLDWGQDLFFLKKWYDEHPEARPFYLVYFGKFDPRAAGVEYLLPQPKGRLPQGYWAVSQTLLHGYSFWVPDGAGKVISFDENNEAIQALRASSLAINRCGYSILILQTAERQP